MNRILVTAMQALVRSEEVASARRKALRAALSDAMRDFARQGQHRGVSCFADCNPMDG